VPDLLTVAQAGKMLGVSRSTVRLWEKAGRLSSVRTAEGQRKYRREDVEVTQAST
jgi:excisionase family DNA binding protein